MRIFAACVYYYARKSSQPATFFVGQAFSLRRIFNPPGPLSGPIGCGYAALRGRFSTCGGFF
jgi:hypothetical protein